EVDNSIKAFSDTWIPNVRLFQPSLLTQPEENNRSVVDFILPSRTWDTAKLNLFFGPSNIAAILVIPLTPSPSQGRVTWNFHESECYIVRSGFHLVSRLSSSAPPPPFSQFSQNWWSTFWNFQISRKVKFFG
ncbi:hypothetical protein PanWU01x14_131050, partial [Parasponia andersonii]